ncbi:efflux RND transporter permease subunit [Pacificimonas flava]|uniref:RND multidrug efflux transporter n=1 Tax=Pacificimonas flava TaxID=1234595 RepID=M2U4V9_9SPHN|nr:efflux RND transporter permease subunit [Pacificimonas flava]EMD83023.1 RND multidrug efflux transporter [Pacificimonas flava]MBB5280181.1 multidrug efflux pump [Pacificimonas flava]
MKLSDVSVKRPVFAVVLSLLLVLAGIVGFLQLPIREYPSIDPPIVSVDVNYPGAAATVVESRITQLLEDRIAGIEGIDTIRSTSRDGRADVSIEFTPDRNVDNAANDVRDRVSGALDNLPEEADPPEINKVDSDARPVMWLNVTGEGRDRLWLADYVDRVLVDRFSSIDGVAQVRVNGARPAIRVWMDRRALAAYRLTPGDIETALRRENVELPAGRVESSGTNLTVRVARAYQSVRDFEQLVVRRGDDGSLLRLGDVARVELGSSNEYDYFRSNGEPGVGLGIVIQSGANTLSVAEGVKARMAEVEPLLPDGVRIGISLDSSVFIAKAIDAVWETLIIAAILVVFVIYLFLGSIRATVIPAVTVPVSLIGTFFALWIFGLSINLLTLLGMVLAIGLVVDDAIVVLENIYHRIEQGERRLLAAFAGARQVGFAVLATSAVTIAVFLPLMFLPGNTGLLFRDLAVTMIVSITISTFTSLTLIPVMCANMLQRGATPSRLSRFIDRNFEKGSQRYESVLSKLVRRPFIVGGVTFALVGALAFISFSTLQSELAPKEDTGFIFGNVSIAEGAGWDRLVGVMDDMERLTSPLVDGEGNDQSVPIRRVLLRAPDSWGPTGDFSGGRMIIFLKDWADRTMSTQETADELNTVLSSYPRARAFVSVGGGLGSGGGEEIEFVIAGDTYEELARARDALFVAADYPGIGTLESDYQETRPQLIVNVDKTRAADLGVSTQEIGRTLESMMGTRQAGTFIDRGEEYDIIMQAEPEDRVTPQDLAGVYVRGRAGDVVPLSALVSLDTRAEAGELPRFNKLRSITLSGTVAPGYSLGDALNFLEQEAMQLPEVAAIGYEGQSRALKQTGGSIWLVLGLSIVLVYLVLAAQFESFVSPLIIVLGVPLAIGGGVFGLLMMGGTLNLYSQIGLVMLVGLAAKNGILIVEFANQLRDEGRSFDRAILEAAKRRLRPVLMTSIATVAGAVPLMIAHGAGAGSRQAIGTVIVWGVSISTVLTLLVIPAFYWLLARGTSSPEAVTRQLEEQIEERERSGGGMDADTAPQPAE